MKGSELKDCESFYRNILDTINTIGESITLFESYGSKDVYGREILETLIKQKNIINECILLWKNQPLDFKDKLSILVGESYSLNIKRDGLILKRGEEIKNLRGGK